MASDAPHARYEALLFDPLARPLLFAAWLAIGPVLAWLAFGSSYFAILAPLAICSPAVLMPTMIERGVWEVDGEGIRARLRSIIPLLPERREVVVWSAIDSYRLDAGDWVPRFLKPMNGKRTLMTVYQGTGDEAKRAAFDRFAETFVQLAASRGINKR